jgi:hypothetical protein
MTEIEKLAKAVRDLHMYDVRHLRSEPVAETFNGQVVWDGVVEVFAVSGHSKAALAYAWSQETDDGGRRYVAVLGVPPISSAVDAVRAAVASEIKAAKAKE